MNPTGGWGGEGVHQAGMNLSNGIQLLNLFAHFGGGPTHGDAQVLPYKPTQV